MNKLIPSALFSPNDSKEQQIHDALTNGKFPDHDIRRVDGNGDRLAEGFRKNDPASRKQAELFLATAK